MIIFCPEHQDAVYLRQILSVQHGVKGMVGCLLEDKTMTARLAILFYLVKSKRKNIIVPQRLIISALVIEK